MANTKKLSTAYLWTVSLDTTGVVDLGEAAEGVVGSWVLQVSGTFSGSLVLRKKLKGSSVANASAPTTSYTNFSTDTAVAAGTAITAGGAVYKVECDGCTLILDYTATSGTMVVETVPLLG